MTSEAPEMVLAWTLAEGAGEALTVEAPLTVAAPPALAAAILRSTTAGAAGVEAELGAAPTSTFWLGATTCSGRTKAAFLWPVAWGTLPGPVTGRLTDAGAGAEDGAGASAVGGVNCGPDWLTAFTGLALALGGAGLAAVGD